MGAEKLHATGKSLAMLVEEIQAILYSFKEYELDLKMLIELREEDPNRHIEGEVQVRPIDITRDYSRKIPLEVPIQQLIDARYKALNETMEMLEPLYEECWRAIKRVQRAVQGKPPKHLEPSEDWGASHDEIPLKAEKLVGIPEGSIVQPIGKPMVGPGRE